MLPLYSRTPTLTAMTAAGLDAVSGGRFVLGIGASGPQIIESWHGVAFDKPLKIINHPVRDDIPIYIASLGHKNVQLTAELADGWLPAFFHPDQAGDVFGEDLATGAKQRAPERAPLEIVAGGMLAICDADAATKLRDLGRPGVALSVHILEKAAT